MQVIYTDPFGFFAETSQHGRALSPTIAVRSSPISWNKSVVELCLQSQQHGRALSPATAAQSSPVSHNNSAVKLSPVVAARSSISFSKAESLYSPRTTGSNSPLTNVNFLRLDRARIAMPSLLDAQYALSCTKLPNVDLFFCSFLF